MTSPEPAPPSRPRAAEPSPANAPAPGTADVLRAVQDASLLEEVPEGFIALDHGWRITFANPAAERLLGARATELVGCDTWQRLPALRGTAVERECRRAVASRTPAIFDFRPAASERWLELRAWPTSAGLTIQFSDTTERHTERKRAERRQQALYELAARVNHAGAPEEIYAAALDAICRCCAADRAAVLRREADGAMRFRAWRGLSDDYRRAVDGHSPWRADDPEPRPVCIDDVATAPLAPALRAAVEREGIGALAFIPLTFERRLLGKFMVYFDAPRTLGADDVRAAEALASQLAFALERQRSAAALETLVDERTASLREAIAQMEEFSYSVSHDLRAPLRAFQGYASVLMEDYGAQLDEAGRDYLARIDRNAQRMDRLIQDLLTYSRLSRRDLERERVSLDALVRQTIQQFPEMHSPAAEIEIVEELLPVIGHEPSVAQIVANLLNNAVKFVAPGTVPRVRVTTVRHDAEVEFSVRDNGIGIAPAHQRRLFALFERIHPATKFEGTGIGLAIVQRAAERMGGCAGVESDGVNGSRFWVRLPAAE